MLSIFLLQSVKYNWTVAMESAVDSSFFWGYLVTQVPGGFLASMFPANRIFGTAIAISAFLNLLVPGAMMLHPTVVILVRVLQGLVEVSDSECLRLQNFPDFTEAVRVFPPPGCNVSRLPRYLALLGPSARALPASDDGIQRLVRRRRDRYAHVRHSDRLDQLARTVLLLRRDGPDLVLLLAVAVVREAAPTSNHLREGAKVHRKVARRVGAAADADHRDDPVASLPHLDARVRDHRGKLLPIVELLPVGAVPECLSKALVRLPD